MKKNRKYGRILRKTKREYDSLMTGFQETSLSLSATTWQKSGDFYQQFSIFERDSFASFGTSTYLNPNILTNR
jgi:hypothetical protein